MNSASKHAVVALFLTAITGCADKTAKTAPPAQAQAPSIAAGKAGALYPPPLTQSEAQPEKPAPTPPTVTAKVEPPPPPPPPQPTKKTTSNHKPKPSAAKPANSTTPAEGGDTTATTGQSPASTASPAPAENTTEMATAGEPAPSPIGQLSTGDAAGQAQTRKDTVDLITNTENGLNGIKRTLSSEESETASQIRTFLAKARQALINGDLDGANTLATKAKVLLDELTKT